MRSRVAIRVRFRSARLPTHTEPTPAAIGPGAIPTGIAATIRFEPGSMTPTAFGGMPSRPLEELRVAR